MEDSFITFFLSIYLNKNWYVNLKKITSLTKLIKEAQKYKISDFETRDMLHRQLSK